MRVSRHACKGECIDRPKVAGSDGGGRRQSGDSDVTRRLNELFADPTLAREQLRAAAELDAGGTGWDDEDW